MHIVLLFCPVWVYQFGFRLRRYSFGLGFSRCAVHSCLGFEVKGFVELTNSTDACRVAMYIGGGFG